MFTPIQTPAQVASSVPTLDKSPLPRDESEKRILAVLDDLDRNQRAGMMNVPLADGRLLRMLTEAVGAKRVVEIGTSNGYSGIWFCLALHKTGGHLVTHDIDQDRAALARQNFERAGVESLVTLILGDAHETVKKLQGPIDILFIDADKPGYPDYLQKLLPLVRPGGLIIGHNMHRPAPDPEYIRAITTNPELETLFLNMHAAGIAVTMKKR
jgi:predicted O-methyltransferase YrrM